MGGRKALLFSQTSPIQTSSSKAEYINLQNIWTVIKITASQHHCVTWPERTCSQHMERRRHDLGPRFASRPRSKRLPAHIYLWLLLRDSLIGSKRPDVGLRTQPAECPRDSSAINRDYEDPDVLHLSQSWRYSVQEVSFDGQ